MRVVSLSRSYAVMLPVLAAMVCFLHDAQAGWIPDIKNTKPKDNGEKIQFSAPDNTVSVTVSNSHATGELAPAVNPLNPTPNAFKQVSEDLFRPLQGSMKDLDSTDPVIVLPPQQQRPVMDKRTKEMYDRKKNWAFTDLDDLSSGPSLEESMGIKQYGFNGQEKDSQSVVEKYYDKLGQKPGQNRNQWANQFDPASPDSTNMSSLAPTLQNGDAFTKKLFSSGRDSDDSDHDVAGFKAPAMPELNSPNMLAAKKHREEFERILNPSLPTTAVANNPLTGGMFDTTKNNNAAVSGFNTQQSSEPHRSVLDPMLGVVDPNVTALHNRVYDDPTAASLGLPNPVTVKTVAPKPPSADNVHRMLDPFSASVMKPKF